MELWLRHRCCFCTLSPVCIPDRGADLGVVDLPIQRERHTQWPNIPGSSLKGVLRDVCRRNVKTSNGEPDEDEMLCAAFGPSTRQTENLDKSENRSTYAGALSFTDARILAFPVRSLTGVFAWTTCPAVLSRFRRDLELTGRLTPDISSEFDKIPKPKENQAICVKDGPLLIGGENLILEEFAFKRDDAAGCDEIFKWLPENAVCDGATQKRLGDHLAILNDDDFTHFIRHATEIVTRIHLKYETKTVEGGGLFSEEFLLAETLFYSVVFAEDSRNSKFGKKAGEMHEYLTDNINAKANNLLQIGADETIGKGLCAVHLWNGEAQS